MFLPVLPFDLCL